MSEDKDTEKVTVRLFKGDKERMQKFFPGVGYNKPIRHVIHNFLKGVEERAMQANEAKTIAEIELPEDFMEEKDE